MIAIVQVPGSPFGEALATRLAGEVHLIDDARHPAGQPLTVAGGSVRWGGIELTRAAAVLVEAPLFAWPQAPGGAGEREARSLALSALLALDGRTRLVNPASTFALAAEPLVALDLLAARGVEVHPWELEGARPEGRSERVWLDPLGRCRGYAPRAPEPGEPAWSPLSTSGPLIECLVVGARVVGAARHADLAAFAAAAAGGELLEAERVPAPLAVRARDAARALGLDLAAALLAPGGALVALAAAPDLAAWDARLDGAVCAALAEHLQAIPATPPGGAAAP